MAATQVRPVWMRVVVDGQNRIEGMIQGGESLYFTGDHSIAVCAANDGDVLVKAGSGEDRFGEVGQPVTRTFLKP
jgi:xanthine/CO dehydrogenase XdhC/CoxF family maturation factor